MEVARELADHGYPREAGPGVERLWANPDCGPRTRGRPGTRTSLANLVAAARTARTVRAGSATGGTA